MAITTEGINDREKQIEQARTKFKARKEVRVGWGRGGQSRSLRSENSLANNLASQRHTTPTNQRKDRKNAGTEDMIDSKVNEGMEVCASVVHPATHEHIQFHMDNIHTQTSTHRPQKGEAA